MIWRIRNISTFTRTSVGIRWLDFQIMDFPLTATCGAIRRASIVPQRKVSNCHPAPGIGPGSGQLTITHQAASTRRVGSMQPTFLPATTARKRLLTMWGGDGGPAGVDWQHPGLGKVLAPQNLLIFLCNLWMPGMMVLLIRVCMFGQSQPTARLFYARVWQEITPRVQLGRIYVVMLYFKVYLWEQIGRFGL